MTRAPSASVVAALVAFLVVALSLFGALEELPQAVRGLAQAIGTLAGIYRGAHFQSHDQRRTSEGAAKTSILSLAALAKSVRVLLDSLSEARDRLRETPPRSLDGFQNAVDQFITGVDAQGRALLAQAEAAAQAWYPFVREDDPFMKQLSQEAGQSGPPGNGYEGQGVSG